MLIVFNFRIVVLIKRDYLGHIQPTDDKVTELFFKVSL